MNSSAEMLKELDRILEVLEHLSLEECELLRDAFQKRLEYIDLLLQVKRTKASFQHHASATLANEAGSDMPDVPESESIVYGETEITNNDLRFGLLRFPRNSEIANSFYGHKKIQIKYADDTYNCSISKQQIGRINRLTALYRDHPEISKNRQIRAKYNSLENLMIIEN